MRLHFAPFYKSRHPLSRSLMQEPTREKVTTRPTLLYYYGRRFWRLGEVEHVTRSRGDRGRDGRKANAPQQMLEQWVAAQGVHARVQVKIDKPMGVLLVAFLQIFKSEVVLS